MKTTNYFIYILIALSFFVKTAISQTDTEFWLAAPDVTSGHASKPIKIIISTLDNASTVTVSLPANAGFTPITFNVPANSVYEYDLTPYIDDIENVEADNVNNKGVLIQASTPVNAYYNIMGTQGYPNADGFLANSDILSLKGRYGLGTEFYISQQNKWPFANQYICIID